MNISLHDPELYYFLSLLAGIAALLASLYAFSSPRRDPEGCRTNALKARIDRTRNMAKSFRGPN